MWSYVHSKAKPRWLWHAIDHHTGKVLAYVFGRRQDDVFLKLQQLLAPFGITKFYTDGWGGHERHLAAEQHQVGSVWSVLCRELRLAHMEQMRHDHCLPLLETSLAKHGILTF